MATHSSILPGKSHDQRSLEGYSPWAHKVVRDWACVYTLSLSLSHTHTHTHKTNHTLLPFLVETFKLSSLKIKIRSEIKLSLLLLKTLLSIFKNAWGPGRDRNVVWFRYKEIKVSLVQNDAVVIRKILWNSTVSRTSFGQGHWLLCSLVSSFAENWMSSITVLTYLKTVLDLQRREWQREHCGHVQLLTVPISFRARGLQPTRLRPMGFPRQEHWSGLPFPPPGDLSLPGIKPASPAVAGEFFSTEPPGKLRNVAKSLSPVKFYMRWIVFR